MPVSPRPPRVLLLLLPNSRTSLVPALGEQLNKLRENNNVLGRHASTFSGDEACLCVVVCVCVCVILLCGCVCVLCGIGED